MDSLPGEVRGRLQIESTGFHPEEGRRSPEEAVRAAEQLGVGLSDHRSRSLVYETPDYGEREGAVVFVMDPQMTARFERTCGSPSLGLFVLGDFDPAALSRRRIRDPFGHRPEVFDKTFERIRRCVEQVRSVWKMEQAE